MAGRKTFGMNRHQKAAHRTGERRVGREQIAELLEMSRSEDANDRLVAARYLCPCHVRHRDEEVWEALYRMLEDEDVRVRKAAWHTLEDGGCPDDPALDPIVERTLRTETDSAVLGFARTIARPRRRKQDLEIKMAGRVAPVQHGKCDFCGRTNVPVTQDFAIEIPAGAMSRAALVCDACAQDGCY